MITSGRAVAAGTMVVDEAWRAVLIALMSSMLMKTLICGFLGGWRLMWRAALVFGLNIAAGVVIVRLWP